MAVFGGKVGKNRWRSAMTYVPLNGAPLKEGENKAVDRATAPNVVPRQFLVDRQSD
jgi:hypothetical protein